ncbi:hypothetical protein [Methanosarcina sp.]|uniref:DUF7490 domain-containing protein n=1 Tax=Methanosarcina sp. TaxID=2213 RepID=UPI002AB8B96F|nr:hypothetical protein [Methanosarcina sp.]MDY9926627.1 hypothetical protein [Methanosarcina sp.]
MDISADRAVTSFVDLNVTTYVEKYQGDTDKNTSPLLKIYSRESELLEEAIISKNRFEEPKKLILGGLKYQTSSTSFFTVSSTRTAS